MHDREPLRWTCWRAEPTKRVRRGSLEARGRSWPTPVFAAASVTGSACAVDGAELVANGVRAVHVDPVAADVFGLHGPLARLEGPRAILGGDLLIVTGGGSRTLGQLPRGQAVGGHGRLLRTEAGAIRFASPVDGSVRLLSPGQSAWLQAEWEPDLATLPSPVATSAREDATPDRVAIDLWRREAARVLRDQGVPFLVEARDNEARDAEARLDCARRWEAIGCDLGAVADAPGASPPEVSMRVAWWDCSPDSLDALFASQVDVVCSAVPARLGRLGLAAGPTGWLDARSPSLAGRLDPLVDGCGCTTCLRFSASYLRHLLVADELLGYRLLTLHNLWWAARLVDDLKIPVPTAAPEDARATPTRQQLTPYATWSDPL